MRIYLLAPFFSGSHRQWAEGLRKHSRHDIQLFTLPGRRWKWRMHGAAVSFAEQLASYATRPDLILTTDMLDGAALRGLLPARWRTVPLAVYFHENQLSYPWSPTDADPPAGRDRHYMWINFTSALAADAVFFNSAYHRTNFLAALPAFLRAFPDERPVWAIPAIEKKARVLSLGLDLAPLAQAHTEARTGPAVLLWNHRWEYDKNPDTFFGWCTRLLEEGLDFRLTVLGDHFRKGSPVFATAKAAFAERILHWGFAPDRARYAQLLAQADILPVTSYQDFFGGSVVEALYANTYPILPDRLAYPEHLPEKIRPRHLYGDDEAGYQLLKAAVSGIDRVRETHFRSYVQRYDWPALIGDYDAAFTKITPS
jgi:glycosyltransferase involved in cell wall biosynthesis